MKIDELRPAEGSKKKKKRVGRGPGSGHGKTSCRGHKGQKARSGGGVSPGFEGGQMPLHRRLPKRGFRNAPFRKVYTIVNIKTLERLKDVDVITPELLLEKGVIKGIKDGLKVLGDGELSRAITIRANAFSETARKKIEQAGGKVEVI
ncbi:MAG TPA: 50S ribosomal protein L15 [Nitrospirae bacterium]|nr:50S ribosomal protein L15 [Nitrospirota bacterium]